MASSQYPFDFDVFINPKGDDETKNSNPELKHSFQHAKTNEALKKIQNFVGISGSQEPTSVEFRLNELKDIVANTSSSSGLSPEDRFLILLAGTDGPFEDYNSGAVRDLVYTNKVHLSASIWYTDTSKTSKIMEQEFVYNSKFLPTSIIFRIYEKNGNTIKRTVIDNITYNGLFEVSRTRTIL